MFVPQMRRSAHQGPPWRERSFLVTVSSYNFLDPVSRSGVMRAVLARFLSRVPQAQKPSIRRQLVALRDPALARELYTERLRAIRHFSSREDFALYGRHWRDVGAFRARVDDVVLRRYRGIAEDKLAVMSNYRFALCFENASFPGYITEKIFDAFFAGCIPVYLGAPDVERYIPRDAFVDVREFRTHEELEHHLRGVGEAEARHHLEAARTFLASPAFDAFFHEHAMRLLADALLECI